MKKLILLILALLSTTSCRQDDESKSTILGTWKSVGYKYISGKDGSTLHFTEIPETDCITKSNYTYKSNGKFVVEHFYNPQDGGCWNIGQSYEMDYSYNESEKTISYKIDGITQELRYIHSLTKNEIQFLMSDKMDVNGDGTDDLILHVQQRKAMPFFR